jgi:hypothetical protein
MEKNLNAPTATLVLGVVATGPAGVHVPQPDGALVVGGGEQRLDVPVPGHRRHLGDGVQLANYKTLITMYFLIFI